MFANVITSNNTKNPQNELVARDGGKVDNILFTVWKKSKEYDSIPSSKIKEVVTNTIRNYRTIINGIKILPPFFEVLHEGTRVRPYLDCEEYFSTETPRDEIDHRMQVLQSKLREDIKVYFKNHTINITDDNIKLVHSTDIIHVKNSKDVYKLSIHVIVNKKHSNLTKEVSGDIGGTIINTVLTGDIGLVVFNNTIEAKSFYEAINSPFYTTFNKTLDKQISSLDKGVYGKTQLFRVPHSIKSIDDRRYLTNAEFSYSHRTGTLAEKTEKILEYFVGAYTDDVYILPTPKITGSIKTGVDIIRVDACKSNSSNTSLNKSKIINKLTECIQEKYNHINVYDITYHSDNTYRVKTINTTCVDNVIHSSDTREQYINYYPDNNTYYIRCPKCNNSHQILILDNEDNEITKFNNDTTNVKLEKLYSLDQFNKEGGYGEKERRDVEVFHKWNEDCITNNIVRVLRTSMGTGKSQMMGREIRDILIEKPDARILVLTPRKALVTDLLSNALKDCQFTNYLSLQKSCINYHTVSRLILCIKSIGRLVENRSIREAYDYIYIDEVNSCMGYLDTVEINRNFKIVMNASCQLLLLDAAYNHRVHDYFSSIKNTEIIHNQFKPRYLNIKVYSSPISFIADLIRDIQSGKKIGALTTCQKMCQGQGNLIYGITEYKKSKIKLPSFECIAQTEFGEDVNKKFMAIHSGTKNKNGVIENLDMLLEDVKLLSYTSTLDCGVDIQTRFSNPLYFFITSGCVDYESINQSTGRIRHIAESLGKTVDIRVCFSGTSNKKVKFNNTDKYYMNELDIPIDTLISIRKKMNMEEFSDDERYINTALMINKIKDVSKRDYLIKSLYNHWIGDEPYSENGVLFDRIEGNGNTWTFYDRYYTKSRKLQKNGTELMNADIELIKKYSTGEKAEFNVPMCVNDRTLDKLIENKNEDDRTKINYNLLYRFLYIREDSITNNPESNSTKSSWIATKSICQALLTYKDCDYSIPESDGIDADTLEKKLGLIKEICKILNVKLGDIDKKIDRKRLYNSKIYKSRDVCLFGEKTLDLLLTTMFRTIGYSCKLDRNEISIIPRDLDIKISVVKNMDNYLQLSNYIIANMSGIEDVKEDGSITYKNNMEFKLETTSNTYKHFHDKKYPSTGCLITLNDEDVPVNNKLINDELEMYKSEFQELSKNDEYTDRIDMIDDNDSAESKQQQLEKINLDYEKDTYDKEVYDICKDCLNDIIDNIILDIGEM